MRLVDANLIIYALDSDSPHRRRARPWFEDALNGPETLALPWAVLLAVLRISTNSRIMTQPRPPHAVLDLIDSWLAMPWVRIIEPTERHGSVLRDLLASTGAGGNLVSDAHLASLAIEHGAELCSADTDFARFPGLRWTNPLA